MAYSDTMTTDAAFTRYESVRHRFPSARFASSTVSCKGLVDIADQFDAFFLDSFGVLNVGDRPIPGATECIQALRDMGKRLIVLTNAASYTCQTAIEKYQKLGFDFTQDEVVSSRDVALARLDDVAPGATWGAVAAVEDRFEDIRADVVHWQGQDVDGFLLLSSASLTPDLLEALRKTLSDRPRPLVVANPDLVAPRETGLSKEPGYFAHLLADEFDVSPLFLGKPFGNAFEDAWRRVPGISPDRIAMVGDTLHTDILGGAAFGAKTVLVQDYGLFAGCDVDGYIRQSGIVPDFACKGI